MDVCESERAALRKKPLKLPLSPAERNNGTNGRSKIREVSSRYRSPSPSVTSSARRCPSPNVPRASVSSSVLTPKRSISAERKRPSSPLTRSPSTPVAEAILATKKLAGNKLPEGLWPSTMRSLSVSFQSDSFSLPVSKREKPPPLRSSPNIIQKQGETIPGSRKPTPERKRSLIKGKGLVDQSENSRPVDGLNTRLVDQHRWPTMSLTRSVDLSDKASRASNKRLSLDGSVKPLRKASSDLLMLMSSGDSLLRGSTGRSLDVNSMVRTSRGVSPSRTKPISVVPSRVRSSSPCRQPSSTTSVLSFIVDIKKGKKDANHIEDAHQLRLLYNRHLQWRYANSRALSVLQSQKVKAEKILYNVWRTISDMWDSLIAKRIELQQLRLKLNLYSVLSEQLVYLDQWYLIESDHMSSLSLATQELRDCTHRLPIACGARGDLESVKSAVCSAVDNMQAMASSICSLLSPVEGMNCLISELADIATKQRAVLDECEAFLASTAALKVEEYSLRTNLIQLRQSL